MPSIITATDIIAGPADLYVAPFGTLEPADGVASLDVAWRSVGGTTGGVRLVINRSYMDLEVDQVAEPVGKRITSRSVSVATKLTAATLKNLAVVLAELETAVVTTTGTETFQTAATDLSAEPNYIAVLLEGPGDGGKRRRVIVRRALSVESVEVESGKGTQTGLPVTFAGHYVSSAIRSFKVMQTAAP